jgi:hypothetical protein
MGEPLGPAKRPQFRIATLMVIIALVAALLWVFTFAPGLGVLLLFPAAIASIRTAMASPRSDGGPLGALDYLVIFLGTFGLAVSVMVASAIAFFLSCLAVIAVTADRRGVVHAGDWTMIIALIVGGVVGLATMAGVTASLVKSHRDERPPSSRGK